MIIKKHEMFISEKQHKRLIISLHMNKGKKK